MPNWDEQLDDLIFREAADLARLEASTVRSVLYPVFREARKELLDNLRVLWNDMSWEERNRTRSFIGNMNDLLAQTLDPLEEKMTPVLTSLMSGTLAQAAKEINTVLQVPLMSTTAPPAFYNAVKDRTLIEGQPLFTRPRADGSPSWWSSLSTSSRARMAREIRKSLVLGESTDQATLRLLGSVRGRQLPKDGVLGMTIRNAESIARTGIHAVTNATRSEFYEENTDIIQGVKSLATLDKRTTTICRAYDGLKWTVPEYDPIGNHTKIHIAPPRHFRCRSVETPILAGLDEIDAKAASMGLKIKPSVRAARDGPRVRNSIEGNMDGWMRSQSERAQDAMLGQGKADLWRKGKISLQDLVDNQGRTVSLTELERLAGTRSIPN